MDRAGRPRDSWGLAQSRVSLAAGALLVALLVAGAPGCAGRAPSRDLGVSLSQVTRGVTDLRLKKLAGPTERYYGASSGGFPCLLEVDGPAADVKRVAILAPSQGDSGKTTFTQTDTDRVMTNVFGPSLSKAMIWAGQARLAALDGRPRSAVIAGRSLSLQYAVRGMYLIVIRPARGGAGAPAATSTPGSVVGGTSTPAATTSATAGPHALPATASAVVKGLSGVTASQTAAFRGRSLTLFSHTGGVIIEILGGGTRLQRIAIVTAQPPEGAQGGWFADVSRLFANCLGEAGSSEMWAFVSGSARSVLRDATTAQATVAGNPVTSERLPGGSDLITIRRP
jgi:hypothetical protein